MKLGSTLLSALFAFTSSGSAFAHGGHDPRIKLAVNDQEIRFETSLEASLFLGFDSNQDGELSVLEYEMQYEDIAKWIDGRLSLRNRDSRKIPAYFADAPIIGRAYLENEDAISHIKVLRRYKLDAQNPPRVLGFTLSPQNPSFAFSKAPSFAMMADFQICTTTATLPIAAKCQTPFHD